MDSILSAQQQLAERRLGLTLAGFRVDQRDELLAWASRLQGVCLYGLLTCDLLRCVGAQADAVVALGALQDGTCPSGVAHVEADAVGAMTLAMEFLMGQRHRRICLINRTLSRYYTELGAAFRRAAAEAGATESVTEVIADDVTEEAALVERLKRLTPSPTALLVEGGRRACRLIASLAEAGWRVPEMVSVMAINGRPPQDLFYPELTRVDLNWQRMLQRAMDAVVELLGSGCALRERTSLRLVWGSTVRELRLDDQGVAPAGRRDTLLASAMPAQI